MDAIWQNANTHQARDHANNNNNGCPHHCSPDLHHHHHHSYHHPAHPHMPNTDEVPPYLGALWQMAATRQPPPNS